MRCVTCCGTVTWMQMRQGVVHRGKILFDECFSALAVGFADCLLDLVDRLFARQHSADREEAGLHDRVDAVAHSRIASHRVAVNHKKLQLFVDDCLLHRSRQVIPDVVRPKRRVEQKCRARLRRGENVHALQKLRTGGRPRS